MNHSKHLKEFFTVLILLGLSVFLTVIPSFSQKKWELLQTSSNDSLYKNELSKYEFAVLQKDTSLQIQSLIGIAYSYGSQAKYKDSYDNLWKALLLANESKDLYSIALINQKLGRHYGYYRRKEEAIVYFQNALAAQNEIIKNNPSQKFILADTYHQLCSFYRDLNDAKMQKQYIDSCYKYMNKEKKKMLAKMVAMEEAVVLMEYKE